jgi:hypothetical protein
MKEDVTTIQLKKSVVKVLNSMKNYERETYSELIQGLIDFVKSDARKKEYADFIKFAQEKRMRDLWDNKEDEVWGNV